MPALIRSFTMAVPLYFVSHSGSSQFGTEFTRQFPEQWVEAAGCATGVQPAHDAAQNLERQTHGRAAANYAGSWCGLPPKRDAQTRSRPCFVLQLCINRT